MVTSRFSPSRRTAAHAFGLVAPETKDAVGFQIERGTIHCPRYSRDIETKHYSQYGEAWRCHRGRQDCGVEGSNAPRLTARSDRCLQRSPGRSGDMAPPALRARMNKNSCQHWHGDSPCQVRPSLPCFWGPQKMPAENAPRKPMTALVQRQHNGQKQERLPTLEP